MLLVLDESGHGLGGVPVFNMELARGLARNHDVTVLTVNARPDYDQTLAQQQHGTDDVVNIRPAPGQEAMEGRDRLSEVARGPKPPELDSHYDVIVGHSRFSGPAAEQMRDNWFPGARLVHFLHTSPVRLDVVKAGPDASPETVAQNRGKGGGKANQERRVMPDADLVVGVGDMLTSEADRLSQQLFHVPALHSLTPGTEVGPKREPRTYGPDSEIKLLLSGRATDPIKGVESAIRAVGQARANGVPVSLVIRGGPKPSDEAAFRRWNDLADRYGNGGVELRPFVSDPAALQNDREEADAVVMTSLHEGFGLVATEGAGMGIPVLVNQESGAAGFFDQLGHPDSIVASTSDPNQSVGAWTRAITDLQQNMNDRVRQAQQLRDQLAAFSWTDAAQSMVDAAMATPPPTDVPLHERYTSDYHGRVSRQGPGGSVEYRETPRPDWQRDDYWSGQEPYPGIPQPGGPISVETQSEPSSPVAPWASPDPGPGSAPASPAQTWSSAPRAHPDAAPDTGSGTRATPTPEFQQAKGNAEPMRLRTERYNPSKDTVVPGTHLLRGEITTIDFTSRDFTADGTDYRSFDVHLDLVSDNDRMSPQQLRDFADAIQGTVDQMVNGRYTLPDGRQLHIDLTVDTPPWRGGMMDDWQGDPHRNPPVEVTSDPAAGTDQHRWNTGGSLAAKVHEVLHFLGAKEGYHADHHLLNTTDRPGVMGQGANTLPTSSQQAATAAGPTDYLTDQDLATIHDVSRTAGPVREMPATTPQAGGGPRAARPRFEPVRVGGGRNAAFDELTGTTRDIGPGNYRQETIDLKNDGAPIGFVVNSMLPADDIEQLPDVVRSITDGLGPDTRVAFVFGVNTTAETPGPDFEAAVARAARIADTLDVPVAVNGYSVGTKNGKFPYGRTRNQVLRDPDTTAAIQGLAQGGPDGTGKRYPYVSVQDFDRGARTVADGTHVFDRIDARTRFDPDATGAQPESPARPMMISGGYRVGDPEELVRRTQQRLEQRAAGHQARIADLTGRTDPESRKELETERQKLAAVREGLGKLSTPAGRDRFVRDFTTAVDEDMRSRDRQATVHSMLPYSPEPNLFVDGLLVLGRPEVRFGDAGAEFLLLGETLHEAYGQELATAHGGRSPAGLPDHILTADVQVASQNNRHPDRDQAFMTDFVGSATPTDLSRLAADFAAGNFLPQSHAVPTTVNRQLFDTEGTGFKEYRADLRNPAIAAAKPFSAPTDVVPGPQRSWQQTLSPQQLAQLGAQPHNQLVPTVSLPAPGTGPTPPADSGFTVDPALDPSRPARTVGLPTSQRLVAAHLVATSNDAGTIQQEFAAATAVADRGGLSRHPDSLYDAIAGALPGADPDALRISTLLAGRDRMNLDDAVGMRQARPYDNAHFVKAVLAVDPGVQSRATPVSDAERARTANAHDVVELAAATGARVHLTVHDGSDGPPKDYPVRGARPLGRLELVRTISPLGRVTYAPYVPPPASPTDSDSDSDNDSVGFGMFDSRSETGDSDRGGLDTIATFAPAADTPVTSAVPAPPPGTVDAGLVFAAPGDRSTLSTARAYPNRSDRYHVFGHGDADAIRVGPARITPAQLAARIRADAGRRAGRPVVLIVCDSGTDRQNGFAARLARELPGTKIIAPDGVVWAGPTGHAIVTETDLRGPDGEALTRPTGNARFVAFEASPTDPGRMTVTDLPHILDSNAPVGDVDAGRMARAIEQLATWAQSDATQAAARTGPLLEALAPALDDAGADEAHQRAAALQQDAAKRHADLSASRRILRQRADEAPELARTGADASARAGDSPGARRLREMAGQARDRVRDQDGPVRTSLTDAAREAATTRGFAGDTAWAERSAARAAEDLRSLRTRHDELTTLTSEARQWADEATRAAADAVAALELPPGPQQNLALADALVRAYPALNATSRRLSAVDRIGDELDRLGDLPAVIRDIRDAATDAARLVTDLAAQAPRANAAHAASLAHMDLAHESLTESEKRLDDVHRLAERLGVPPEAPAPRPDPAVDAAPDDDFDSDLDPPADLLVETEPEDQLVPFASPGDEPGDAGGIDTGEIGVALTTEGDVALPSPEAVRRSVPPYLRDSRTLGLAEQLRATEGAALGAALRTLDPRLPADFVASVEADSRDDIDQFLGEGRPYPVTLGGRPAELRVTAVLDLDGLTVDRLHDDPGKVAAKAQETLTHTLRHNRDRHVEPKATVTAVPGLVVGVGGSVPTAPAIDHSTTHKSKYTSTTTVKAGDLAEVTVPIRFVARLVEPGRPAAAPVEAAGRVALGVPTRLAKAGPTAPAAPGRALNAPVPAEFGVESVRSRPADPGTTFFDQVEAILAEDGMGDLVRVGAPGRPAVQQLLSQAAFSGSLPKMVVTDPANPHDGWIRSGSLPRAAEKGWRRFFPGRSQQIEVRLVARHLEEIGSVDEATHVDTAAFSGESTDSNTAKRLWNLWGTAGGGTDIPPLSLIIAPRLSGTREGGHTQTIAERAGVKQTVKATAPGVRYRAEYGVQVRVLGRAPRMLSGSVDAFQWTTRDRLRDTVLDPAGADRSWPGRQGSARTHFAPARIERGESFGGAFLTRLGDHGLYDTVADAVRSVPGHDGFRLAGPDELLRHFDDPELARGLSPEVQAALSRDADLRAQLSPEQLRHLADRLVGPGLKIPLIRTGTFHDHVTVVTVKGRLGNLSDGDLLDREKVETAGKQRSTSTVTSTADGSRSAELSLEARVLGPLGRAASAVLGGPRAGVSWAATDERAITGGQATESSHGPALDEEGKPAGVRLREFAGTLDVTVTARSTVRVNQAGRQLSVGAYGRGLPTVIGTTELAPRTRRLDVRMLVPETRVSRARPEPVSGPVPRNEESIEHPLPIGLMTGGPHDLDGSSVESIAGADRLQDAVLDTLREAGQDDIYTFEDGRISTAVADELSPERLTGDPELFSRPLALSNLWHGRRATDARAEVRVSFRPTNPRVVEEPEFARIKRTFASGSSSRTKRGRSLELSVSATGTAGVSGPAVDHGGSTGRPGGAVVASVTPWRRAWGRVQERSVSGVSKLRIGGRAEPEVLVRVDLDVDIVAEARHDTNLVPLDLWPASPTRRAGRRLTLPDVLVRMPASALKNVQDRDRARRHQTSDVLVQLRHAERSGTLRAEQREQRERMIQAQAGERGDLVRRQHTETRDARAYVDRVRRSRGTGETERQLVDRAFAEQNARHRRELDRLTGAHEAATQRLLEAQERQRAAQAEHQQRERDIVRREQQRQNQAAAGPGVPAHAAQPRFRPGPQRSLGIGGVTTHVDLDDRIPHLRRAIARASSEELAQAILPATQGRSPYDNVRGLGSSSLAGAAHLHLSSALNGGRSETLQLERRFRGSSYQVTLSAEPMGEPSFAGLDLVDELSVTDRTVIGESDSRTTSRTLGQVTLTARAQGTETDQVADDATRATGHGPATGTVGGGLTGTAAFGNRATRTTESTGRAYEQSLSVSGPVPTYRAAVRFTLTVTGKGLPEGGVSVQAVRDVTTHSATEGRPPARSAPITPVPAAQTTEAARRRWREADGTDRLPGPGRFAVEDVLLNLPDLHEAARQALIASGAEPGDDVTAALRNSLTVTQVKALPAMQNGAFPVPVPTALGRDLFLDARLVARPKVLRADATVTIGGSDKRTGDVEFEQTTGQSFVLRTAGPMVVGGVGHPGGASRVGERADFAAVNAATLVEQQLYRTDPAAQVKDEGKVSTKTTGKPTERTDPDDKLTRAVEYDVEFRFIARSRGTDSKHRGGSELSVPGGLVVRLDDAAARDVTGRELAPELRATALAVADAAKRLSAAAGRLDSLSARADADPQAVAEAERAVDDAENTWWDAYHAHEAEVVRPPAPPTPAQVPPADVATPTAGTVTAGDPIDVTTGRMIYTEVDARLPGLTLERTHRSDYRWGRSFGPSWASTLDQRIVTDDAHARFLAADGSIRTYPLPAEGDEVPPVLGPGGPLRRLTGGGWLLTEPDRWLLFAPAGGHDDSWLSDVVTDGTSWRIERSDDGTPELLLSSSGGVVVPHLAGRLVTGAHVRHAGETVHLPGFVYDERRHLIEVHNSSGEATRLRYDDDGRIVRWQDRNDEWYAYIYDEAGRCVRAAGGGDHLRCSLRYEDGVTLVTDSLGHVTRYEFNELRQVTAVVDPLGATIRQKWDQANRLLSRTDPLGHVTRFGYDERGRPLTLTLPDGGTSTVTYDETGRAVSITGPGGTTRPVHQRHAATAGELTLDGLGRIRARRDPGGPAMTYGWTAEGDLAWRARSDGSEELRHYDGEGNLVEVIDASGRAVNFEYGPFDLPTARVDQLGNRTEFAYDTELRLITVTDPAGRTWHYEYDAAGRLCGQTDFDGRTQSYHHDDAGRLIAHTDVAGVVTRYGYDALGRVVERRVVERGAGGSVTRLEYDATGNVAAVVSPDAEVLFERDQDGRVVAETINGRTVRTSYTATGDVETRTTPSGRSSRWTFGADGRPESLAAGEHLLRFEHDGAGREIGRTIGDLAALRQSFDAAGRLTGQSIADRAERGYSYDAADHITAITDSLAGDLAFAADDAGRIRTVAGAAPQSYDYDEAGNLIGAGGGRWEFDGTMLVRADDATFEYDAKGRLTGRVDAVGAWRFDWDAEDRMVLAVTPGGDRWRYRYDGFGRRIAKQRLDERDEVRQEITFAWAGDLMLEQSDGTSTTTWDYRPDGSAPVAQTDDDALRTVITDTIGTPTHLVEPGGALTWWSRGDLWGRGADAGATPLRFPGQYFDAETGLHYNRFRYYDPATARYVSPDPLGLSGGPNPTAYVTDPLTVADPLGLTSCKREATTPNPVAAVDPVPGTPSTQTPSSLPTDAAPPPPSALYGMPFQMEVAILDEYGRVIGYETQVRNTPSPPALTTDAGLVGYHARQWFDHVAPASRTQLNDPNSVAARTYEEIREGVYPIIETRPRTGFRSDNIGHQNDPLVGGLNPYNTTTTTSRGVTTTHAGLGNRIAEERDGGRRTARDLGSYFRGRIGWADIGSEAGRDFARIVSFAENARGYESEVNSLAIALDYIASARHSRDAADQWRNVRAWFPPAAPGYASDDYVPRESRPPVASIMPRQSANAITHRAPYYTRTEVTGAPAPAGSSSSSYRTQIVEPRGNRSRSPERRGGSSSHRRRPYGFQGPQTGTTDVRGTAAPVTDPFRTPLADQLTAAQGDPRAQDRILDSFRDQLSYNYTLNDGSTLRVLAANLHGDTTDTDTDLQTLNVTDRGHLQRISDNRDVGNLAANVDCIPLTLAVDTYRQTGIVSQVPSQTQPMEIGEVMKRYPGRDVEEVGTVRGLMEALGAMPDGTTGIVGLRAGGPGTVGHVINVSKDRQGRITFEDAQVPGLATLPSISPDGSVVLIRTSDPAPASDVDMTSVRGTDSEAGSDVEMTSDRGDSDVEMTDFSPTTETFAGVTPEAVAKTTAQTPTVGDPIDVTTGRMILTHTDAVMPGLTLERTYRSDYRWGRSFGRAWASTLDQRIIVDGDLVRYLAADGSLLTYALPAEGEVCQPTTGRALPLRRLVGGGWQLTDPASGRDLLFAAASDTESLLSDVTEAGVRWSVRRDRRGTPTELLSSTGATIVFVSSTGLVTMMSLPNAAGDLLVAAQFGYDRDLNLVDVTNSSGDPESFEYTDGRIVRWEDRNGEWYTYTYDEAGRCVGTDGKGGYLRYRFDYQPGRTVVTDSLGAVRAYELNDRFQVVAETDALGATTRNVWDEAYRLRSTTDALGRSTSSEYDADGRLTSVTRPDGSRSTTTYDELGRAVSWTDFDGTTRNRQFGPDGLMIAEVDATGEVVRYEQPAEDGQGTKIHVGPNAMVRNPAQQVVSMITSEGATEYTYDALGRLYSIEDDRGLTEFGWTLEGDLAWRQSDRDGLEEFLYDGEGNLVESVDAAGRRTFREYGAFDLVTAEIDDDGNRTEYAYDTELRLVTITNPAGETWTYMYDPNGRMVSETDFGGRTQRYAYDAAGQLVEHTDAAGEITHYTYDLLGRVVGRRTGTAVTRFAYDVAGRLVSAEDGDSQIRLERDTAGRVVAETVNGTTVSTSYSEQLGAVTARIRPSGAVTQWAYDEAGRPAVLAAGGQRVRFGYDGNREVSRTSEEGLDLRQVFDETGRLAAQRVDGVTDRRYSYDPAGRLTAVHDAVQGDRVVRAEVPGDVRYTHDALGRPVTRTDAAGEWQFSWDHQDRLVGVVTPGGDRWRYRYDAFGRRIAKQRLGSKDTVLEETVFVWSGDLLVEQQYRSRAGVTTTSWEYHPAMAHPVAQVTDGTMHTVVTDGSGTPMDVVGVDGTRAGGGDTIPLRVGGRYLDAETGLQYDRSRFYDPAAARFLPEPRTAPVPLR